MISIGLIALLIILSILDVIVTNKVIALGGREINPVAQFFMRHLKTFWFIPKLIFTLLFSILLYFLPYSAIFLSIWVIIQGVVDVNNIIVYRRQEEKLWQQQLSQQE